MHQHIITQSLSLTEALKRLNALSGSTMVLFVVDDDGAMVGTLTDGDVRRALVGGTPLTAPVEQVMHRQFRALRGPEIDVLAIREYRQSGISLVPWLDSANRLKQIIDLRRLHTVLPLSAVLMAGGLGERLRPLTLSTPKPLLKIGDKAIIDYNVESLARCGITDITVTTRYLAEQIHEHFTAPVMGVKVKCVTEDKPLGTIGAVALVSLPEEGATVVMNSDLFTNISFEDMYLHHRSSGADITIAAIPYQVSVPYAIISADESQPDRVVGLREKPSYSFMANAGIYIINNALLHTLSATDRTDATDLIERAIAEGYVVSQFPLSGTWIDIGTPSDFQRAQELIK